MMETLKNKGEKSRVEAYELCTENTRTAGTFLVSGDVKIESGRLAGIDNGRATDDSDGEQRSVTPAVSFYMTRDGHTVLTSAVELEQAEAVVPAVRSFVEAVKARYAAEEQQTEE